MSYFAFLCRALVSATSFTVVGNVCKILTVLINISIWDKHASRVGLGALLFCLAAAAAYQQSPLRKDIGVEERASMRPTCRRAASRRCRYRSASFVLWNRASSDTARTYASLLVLLCRRLTCHETRTGGRKDASRKL